MKKASIYLALLASAISTNVMCQNVIRFKSKTEGIKITEISIANTRYGDGIRRGTTSLAITALRENGDILSVSSERSELTSLTDDKKAGSMKRLNRAQWARR